MARIPWFQRKFSFPEPTEVYPDVLARLRGAPARVEEAVADLDVARATERFDGEWSIQENVGHLADLEPLWDGRVDDFEARADVLRPADLTNAATNQANHNAATMADVCAAFRKARRALLSRLEAMSEDDFGRTSRHPRLDQPMRLLDLCLFVAAHDSPATLDTVRLILKSVLPIEAYAAELAVYEGTTLARTIPLGGSPAST